MLMSRRCMIAGAVSLSAAGAIAGTASAGGVASADDPSQVDAWSFRLDATLDAIEAATVEMRAAAGRLEGLRPAMPGALFRTQDDRRMEIFGDPLREDGKLVTGHGGAPVMIVSSWWLQEAIERLEDYPHHVARLKPRLTIVAAYEEACARALDASGLSAAEDATFRARVSLEALIERMLDEAADLPGIARPLARAIAAYAALGGPERSDAGARWGVKLAELIAGPTDAPGPVAAPARMAA